MGSACSTRNILKVIIFLCLFALYHRRAALNLWQERNSPYATYRKLVSIFLKAKKANYAEAVCEALALISDPTEQPEGALINLAAFSSTAWNYIPSDKIQLQNGTEFETNMNKADMHTISKNSTAWKKKLWMKPSIHAQKKNWWQTWRSVNQNWYEHLMLTVKKKKHVISCFCYFLVSFIIMSIKAVVGGEFNEMLIRSVHGYELDHVSGCLSMQGPVPCEQKLLVLIIIMNRNRQKWACTQNKHEQWTKTARIHNRDHETIN